LESAVLKFSVVQNKEKNKMTFQNIIFSFERTDSS